MGNLGVLRSTVVAVADSLLTGMLQAFRVASPWPTSSMSVRDCDLYSLNDASRLKAGQVIPAEPGELAVHLGVVLAGRRRRARDAHRGG